MFATILFLGLYYAYTGFDDGQVVDYIKVAYGLMTAIVSVVVILNTNKYE